MNIRILERYFACVLTCCCIAVLSGCGRPESTPASQTNTSTPGGSLVADGTSSDLTRSEGNPTYFLDRIQKTGSPYGQPSVTISSVSDTELAGWAVDGLVKKEAGGVDIVVDGKAYKASYGADRPDVTEALKFPATKSGFSLVIPGNFLSRGSHTVSVRVIANDGKSYAEGPTLTFVAE